MYLDSNDNTKLKDLAKTLRKNATKEERILWRKYLSTHPVRFRRQQIIENFIVDFYCHDAKLVIELDGSQHYEEKAQDYDKQRSMIIENLGIKIVRFPNNAVMQNFSGVCQEIDNLVKERG